MRDALGERMKSLYEIPARHFVPANETLIVRLDGRAFHTYTRGLDKPFDDQLVRDMTATAEAVAREVAGCALAYTQSDEISLVVRPTEQPWFGGNTQKIASVTASIASGVFNTLRPGRLATFDSRVFTIPDKIETLNYLIWRQADAMRNSMSMAGQATFSHRQLHKVGTREIAEWLRDVGQPWDELDARYRMGVLSVLKTCIMDVEYVDKRSGKTHVAKDVMRGFWESDAAPRFTEARAELETLIWR